jgi:mono/diheme cytochrome c family protein
MIRYLFLVFGLTAVVIMLVAGKRGDISRRPPIEVFPDMDRQPKLRPQTGSEIFGDGFSSRLPVVGTVARGSAWQENSINTGRVPGSTNWVATIPIPVTQQLMARGRERFQINCTPCHGAEGDGKGITTKFGMTVIANLHDATSRKVVQQPDGEIFNTISNGKLLMGGYAANITIEDRWAIVAYVRALQRSRLANLDDVPAERREALARVLPPTGGSTNATNATKAP